ncbi:MAG: DUF4352 domain-containing protein [Bacteroidia bacterium]
MVKSKFKSTIIYGITLLCVILILLSFHFVFAEKYSIIPKEHFTFSNTFIFESDIDNIIKRYNEESFIGKAMIASEPLSKKLMEKGIIYTDKNEPEVSNLNSQPAKTNIRYFKIGDEIKFGESFIITVTKYDDNVHLEYLDAGEGRKFVAVEIIYNNISNMPQSLFDLLKMNVYDDEGFIYEYANLSKKPEFSFISEINSGKKQKGWLTFEVSKSAKNLSLQLPQGAVIRLLDLP